MSKKEAGMKYRDLLTLEEAYDTVMRSVFTTGNETVGFTGAYNRVLMEDIISDTDMPPFNKATVDGYACRREDLPEALEVVETIPAGQVPGKKIGRNLCSKIMTGAAVPEGADMVFMVEDSEALSSGKVRFTGSISKDNIAMAGEDLRTGDIILRKGRTVRPQDMALLAMAGYTSVTVARKPVVGIISTGNELVEPWEKPGRTRIRNTNSYQLAAQVERAGGEGVYHGIAPDDEDATLKIIRQAISGSDIVLITGGVSMGDFDFVPSVIEKAGVRLCFSGINIQPGKPTTFGIHEKSLIFGLPGNPVSSFIQFEILVRPLLCRMMGFIWEPQTTDLPMATSYSRRSGDRMAFIPVRTGEDGFVSPVEYHGSAHISALSDATGIISIPAGVLTIGKGEMVNVRQV